MEYHTSNKYIMEKGTSGIVAKEIDKGFMIIDGGISDCAYNECRIKVDSLIDSYPPCYRFCPTDEELVVEYLMKKVLGRPLPLNRIMNVDLYSCSPQRLSGLRAYRRMICVEYKAYEYGDIWNTSYGSHAQNFNGSGNYCKEMYELKREEEWYFFTSRNKKYPKGNRPSRATGNGFWKASGADTDILSSGDGGHILGYKKALVYYEGSSQSGNKTDWKMHEYRLDKHDTASPSMGPPGDMKLDEWVLCKIYRTRKVTPKPEKNNHHPQEDEEMQAPTPTIENQPNADYLENGHQYPHNGGMQYEIHNEDVLPDAENSGNIHQYHHNQGMPLDYNDCYGVPNPGPCGFYSNGSADDMHPLEYLLQPAQCDSVDYSLFS